MENRPNYPGNKNPDKTRKIEPIAKGSIRKKSRLREALIAEDFRNMGDWLIFDVVIPAVKNIISEAFNKMLFGNNRARTKGYEQGVPYTSYSRPTGTVYSNIRDRQQPIPPVAHILSDIGFTSESDATNVYYALLDDIQEYGMVSVAKYLELSGITPQFTDHNFGWTSLPERPQVKQYNGEWTIDLPRTRALR